MTFKEFLSHCTACGGNWTAMIMTGIKEVAPDLHEKMPDRSYSFDEACFIANHLCHDRPHLRYNYSIETGRMLEYTPMGTLVDREATAKVRNFTIEDFDRKMNGITEEDRLKIFYSTMKPTCKGCLDYDDCPYHEPSDYTPYFDDGTVGCKFGFAKEDNNND